MRFHTTTLMRAARPTQAFAPVSRRSFAVSVVRAAGKEDALHDENRHNEAEHHKQDQLQKQKEGKGHWKPELASNSEEMISADKHSADASKESIDDLQKQSREHIHEKHGQN